MKEKSRTGLTEKSTGTKNSTTNLFLNLTLFALAVVVAFLSYSLITKIKGGSKKVIYIENRSAPAAIIQLEVLNGCGAAGVADKVTDYLRKNHVDVVSVGNYITGNQTNFDIDKSLVIDRTGNKANAEKIADILGIDHKNIVKQVSEDYFLDVSLVIGKDYNQLISKTK